MTQYQKMDKGMTAGFGWRRKAKIQWVTAKEEEEEVGPLVKNMRVWEMERQKKKEARRVKEVEKSEEKEKERLVEMAKRKEMMRAESERILLPTRGWEKMVLEEMVKEEAFVRSAAENAGILNLKGMNISIGEAIQRIVKDWTGVSAIRFVEGTKLVEVAFEEEITFWAAISHGLIVNGIRVNLRQCIGKEEGMAAIRVTGIPLLGKGKVKAMLAQEFLK